MKEVIRDIWPAAAFLIGLWLITRGIVLLQERDDANLLGFLMVGVPCALPRVRNWQDSRYDRNHGKVASGVAAAYR